MKNKITVPFGPFYKKDLDIEILNNGTVTDTINDNFDFLMTIKIVLPFWSFL